MRRWLLALLALAGGILVNRSIEWYSSSRSPAITHTVARAESEPAAPPPTLDDLAAGRVKIVDLSWPLGANSVFWPGENYKPFELHTLATLERDGVLSKAFASPEHLGTHLDAPNHFERDRPSVDQLEPGQLFGPGVMIDVAGACSADADYRLSLDDVRTFESEHGSIPSGAIVLVRTGWGKFWTNATRYRNQDVMGQMHFPGISAEAAKWLIHERNVRGLGLDTLSVDHGLSRDFPVHHLLGKAGRWGLENLAQLDKLPPCGFTLFVAPIKIETGSGGPARVFAVGVR